MPSLNTFILFPSSNPSNSIICSNDEVVAEQASLNDYLKQLGQLLETIGVEKDVTLFYSSSEISNFLEDIENDLKELYMIDVASTIDEYLQNANAINWVNKSLQQNTSQYFIIDFNNLNIIQLFNHSINEGLEYQLIYPKNKILLLNHLAIEPFNSFVSLIKKSPLPTVFPPAQNLSLINNSRDLENWLSQNRKSRIFNLNPKHGENGKGSHPSNKGKEVSLLECSKEEAQELLENAIGDVRIDKKRLYNYDSIRTKYILFYYEGENPQNQYHGFHISKKNAIHEIPDVIFKRLKEKYH